MASPSAPMASSASPCGSETKAFRVKRKPAPSLERYPSPDPTDPFAPLYVLRNRSSTVMGLAADHEDLYAPDEEITFSLYPNSPLDRSLMTFGSDADVVTPLKSPAKKAQRESHYRTRSHSIAGNSSPLSAVSSHSISNTHCASYLLAQSNLPDPVSPPPSLIRDHSGSDSSNTDVESDPFTIERAASVSPCPSATATSRLAQFLLPKKLSISSINSANQTPPKHQSRRSRKISTASIGSPVPVTSSTALPAKLQYPAFVGDNRSNGLLAPTIATPSALESTYAPRPPRRPNRSFDVTRGIDAGYYSGPEMMQSRSQPFTFPASTPNAARSKHALSPMTIPTPTPSTQSHSSSSYINVSTPSSSTHDIPFPTVVPATPPTTRFTFRRTNTPSSRSPPKILAKSRHMHTRSSIPETTPLACSHVQDEWALPSPSQVARASTLPVITESGIRVPFASLFANRRTIVIFLRHFWCPLCQDYMACLTSLVRPEMIPRDMELVIISNGSHTLITKYRQIFGSPFAMYADPSCGVYGALGMKTVGEACVTKGLHNHADEARKCGKEKERRGDGTDYVKRGVLGGIAMVVMRALKVGMPVWEKGGEIGQLGGEFVLGPGMACSYAHRMQSTKGHAPILDVLEEAGISTVGRHFPGTNMPTTQSMYVVAPTPPAQLGSPRRRLKKKSSVARGADGIRASVTWSNEEKRRSMIMTIDEEKRWKEERELELQSLKEKKMARREGGSVRGSLSVSASICGTGNTGEDGSIMISSVGHGGETEESAVPSRNEDDDMVVLFEERRSSAGVVHAFAT